MENVRTTLITAIAASVLAFCGSASADSSGPVAHWKFDEGGGSIAYDSAGANDGTVYGAIWADGILDGALEFDGLDDYVEAPDDLSLDITSQITLSAWVRPNNLNTDQFIVAKWQASWPGSSYACRLDGAHPRFILMKGETSTAKTFTDLPLAANTWNHVAFTWDGDVMMAYLDGEASSQISGFIGPVNSTDALLTVGYNPGRYGTGGDYFGGVIDDVRVYSRALSGGEVEELYGGRPEGDLAAHWKFDEGAGSIAYDSAGNKDGTVLGAAWTDGVLGGALDFEGVGSGVALPDNSPVWLPEYDFTCSMWVYFDTPADVSGYLLDLNWTKSSDPANDNGCTVYRRGDIGDVGFGLNTITTVDEILYSNLVFTEGEWYHIVALRAGTNQEMYVNGSLDNGRICSGSRIDYDGGSYDNDGVSIGRITTNNSPNGIFLLDGKMDDVRIYSRALSAPEIEELYGQTPDGLVAHWKFDEGEGTIAHDSAGDNDGTIYGATWADGVLDGALDFDGLNDNITVPSSNELKLNSAGTISAWINPRDVYRNAIVDKRGGWENGNVHANYFLALGTYNQCSLVIGDGSTWVDVQIPAEELATNTWQHVTGTWDASDARIYLNSRLMNVQPNTLSNLLRNDACPVRIGCHGMDIWYFNGYIDDVRIYNVALSAVQVLALYETAPEPPEAEVYHVDGAGGSDFNDGLSRATAFATVQKAIDSSFVPGGEVIVWPGVYSEAINFLGKAVTVRSGADAAVIEAPGQDAVTFHSGEGSASVLKNFVIRNSALGISANYSSSPTLTNLTIVDNDYGVAAYEDSHPDISNCILCDNEDGDIWGCQARYSFVEQEIDTGPVDGLIGHWKFDEGAGTTAYDSAGANNGSINGAQWIMGQIAGALQFDGTDDYVGIPASDVYEVNDGDISLSMWFKTSEYADQTLIKLRQYDDDPHLEIYTSTTFGNIGTRAMPGGAIAAYNAGRIDDGAWHHVAVSVENGQTGGYKLYLDGTLAAMTTFSGNFDEWNAIAIGNDADDAGFFNGAIDDVRIYDKALSSLDVYLLYQMSRGGPVAHWKFDEGAGSIAYDSAGSNDGVVYGAQWTTGQIAGALDFDGVDDHVVGSTSPFDFEDNTFTVSAWFKTSDTQFVLISEGAYEGGWSLGDGGAGAEGKIKLTLKRRDRTSNAYIAVTSGTYNDGNWHHVVAVITTDTSDLAGNVANIYMDGSPVFVTEERDYPYGGSPEEWRIGTRPVSAVPFAGLMDDVRVYDRGLSAGEVEMLYNGGLAGQDDVDSLRPLFAGSGDYHLLSERGRYWPAHDVWVLDKVSSPCIDMGDPAIEPLGEPMPNGGVLNIGAYGGTSYASMSEWPISSDYDRNGKSDFRDFAVFCDEWLLSLPWAK